MRCYQGVRRLSALVPFLSHTCALGAIPLVSDYVLPDGIVEAVCLDASFLPEHVQSGLSRWPLKGLSADFSD
jgi:hypothetical protein